MCVDMHAGVDVVQVVKPCPWSDATSMTLTATFCIETKLTVSSVSAMKRDESSTGHAAAVHSIVKDAAALTREQKLQGIDSVLNAPAVKLSNQQIVIVKDTWNKMLPWSDICMEYMAERFFFLHPGMHACRHCQYYYYSMHADTASITTMNTKCSTSTRFIFPVRV
jgi:hypothetical protein